MQPDVSHVGLAVDTGDGGSCRLKRPPLGGRTRLVCINVFVDESCSYLQCCETVRMAAACCSIRCSSGHACNVVSLTRMKSFDVVDKFVNKICYRLIVDILNCLQWLNVAG